jgi:ribosomal protein S12
MAMTRVSVPVTVIVGDGICAYKQMHKNIRVNPVLIRAIRISDLLGVKFRSILPEGRIQDVARRQLIHLAEGDRFRLRGNSEAIPWCPQRRVFCNFGHMP